MGGNPNRTMTCNICNLNKDLYLYNKDNLIYSLCKSCLKTQDQIDEINNYNKMLNKIVNGDIRKEDFQ